MARVFKTKRFSRDAARAGIDSAELCEAVQEAVEGKADDLGGGVVKKRLKKNQYRSIILMKSGDYWVYQYLFANKTARTSPLTNWPLSESWRRLTAT